METNEVVQEIMNIHRSFPTRPGIDEVEAAKSLMVNVEREDEVKLEVIIKQKKGKNVSEEIFRVFQEMQKQLLYYQSKEQKIEALRLLDLENVYVVFDELIQRASDCLSGTSGSSNSNPEVKEGVMRDSSRINDVSYSNSSSVALNVSLLGGRSSGEGTMGLGSLREEGDRGGELVSKDDNYLKKGKKVIDMDGVGIRIQSRDVFVSPRIVDSTLNPSITSGQDGEKLSLIKLASLIEVSAKKGTTELDLQNRLIDQVDWLPDSIGKLSSLVSLDLSENKILFLPGTIGGLSSLQKLDLSGNKLSELPESVGDLLNLVTLDLSGNQLRFLPPTVASLVRLQELNLSSNNLHVLPNAIGSLVSLKKLDVETNELEEIPHMIGQCSSLQELRVDYNRLKALPEAVGRIGSLEVLSVRYNNIRQLPTTMASMTSLKELNVSFNELEYVPESLCFATTLVKMNISNNFADMRDLPRSFGNLENLEELNMSNNQIRTLPDSFRMLSKLRILIVDGNPLEFPSGNILAMGAQAVVQFMEDLVTQRDIKSQPVKQKKSWVQMLFFSKSNKRKRIEMAVHA
ncbi:scaffold/adaptor protein [Lithospermum erythrorhizon]|uniref:Scaffold/adaptor protein n=1 Tax=Lithospermum erythrorhizon TaxID=34254 RepID=A0AAV3P5X6_LITER